MHTPHRCRVVRSFVRFLFLPCNFRSTRTRRYSFPFLSGPYALAAARNIRRRIDLSVMSEGGGSSSASDNRSIILLLNGLPADIQEGNDSWFSTRYCVQRCRKCLVYYKKFSYWGRKKEEREFANITSASSFLKRISSLLRYYINLSVFPKCFCMQTVLKW